jgi:hypothetical protein
VILAINTPGVYYAFLEVSALNGKLSVMEKRQGPFGCCYKKIYSNNKLTFSYQKFAIHQRSSASGKKIIQVPLSKPIGPSAAG